VEYRARSVYGDVLLQACGGEVMVAEVHGIWEVNGAVVVRTVGKIDGDVSLASVARVELERVENDLRLDGIENALVGRVGNDVHVNSGIASLRCGSVGNDCTIVGNGNAEVIVEKLAMMLS